MRSIRDARNSWGGAVPGTTAGPIASRRWISVLLCGFLVVAVQAFQTAHAEWSFLDSWKAHPEFKGPVPKNSDVIFSTRFKRDEAPEVAKTFGVTRIEWVYSADAAYIAKLREVAPWFGGTLSSTIPLKNEAGTAKDIEGKPIVAPWMKSWGAKWITVSSEEARTALVDLATAYIRAGASSIQIDDPLLQFNSRIWAGDFSDSSIVGFRQYVQQYPDKKLIANLGLVTPSLNYRQYLSERYGIRTTEAYSKRQNNLQTTAIWHAYLKQSVLSHYSSFRESIDAAAGKHVPVSMNLLLLGPDEKRDAFAVVPFADYAMVETKIGDYDVMTLHAATYRALGMGFVSSILPSGLAENRTAIATLYALGGQPLVPWDIYVNQGPDKKPTRFFGKVDEYADIFHFVRQNAEAFDGFELLPVVGILAPMDHYDLKSTLALVRRLNRAGVPFVLVPIGVNYNITPEKLKHLRLLISVNAVADISRDNKDVIQRSSIEMVSYDQLTAERLGELSPFQELPPITDRVIVRGSMAGPPRLAIHLVSTLDEEASNESKDYTTTLSIKKEILGQRRVSNATLLAGNNSPLRSEQVPSAFQFKEFSCHTWRVIYVKF